MTVNELTKEGLDLAILFHNTYESLAPAYGYKTREDTKEFDPESPNGKLMIAVCSSVLKKKNQEIANLEAEADGWANALEKQGLFVVEDIEQMVNNHRAMRMTLQTLAEENKILTDWANSSKHVFCPCHIEPCNMNCPHGNGYMSGYCISCAERFETLKKKK